MADPVTWAVVIASVAATTGATYTVAAGEDQARKAKNARERALRQAADQQAALEAEETKKTSTANAAAYRQARKARGMYGSSDTILGGGTIDANTQPGGTMSGKTQLGA